MHQRNRSSIAKRVTQLTVLICLAGTCVASALLLFGQAGKARVASFEGASLANVEVTELVGSASYAKTDSPQPHSLFQAVATGLHLPFSNPLSILTAELPQTLDSIQGGSTMQSSLFQSLTTWAEQNGKMTIGWATDASSSTLERLLVNNPGIHVLCPSWLQLATSTGDLTNHVQSDVVQFAHKRHIQVWAMLDNQFSRKLTRSVLENHNATQTLIDQITHTAKTSNLDGINIDFENIDPVNRDLFTTFIAVLHARLHSEKVSLSVDITPDIIMMNDDAEFFHAGLAGYCDYIVLMAYDEHWSNDQTPGPVADVPWVTNAVYDLLDTGVPTDKLILGLPFYARFWHVHQDGTVTSEAVGTRGVKSILNEHHATDAWNDVLGVRYAKYTKPDGYEEVWYEDSTTLARKLKLVNDSGLAGVAIWTLQLSDAQTWANLVQALRQSVS